MDYREYKGYKVYLDGSVFGVRGKFIKPSLSNKGYYRVGIYGKKVSVHRLLMSLFVGESELDVNHINGIKTDNRLENLEYVSRKENIKHAWDNGLARARYGKNMWTTKISDDIINQINSSNDTNKNLAEIFNISRESVRRIKNNTQRKWELSEK